MATTFRNDLGVAAGGLSDALLHDLPPRSVLARYVVLRKNIVALRKELVKHNSMQQESFKSSVVAVLATLPQELKRFETAMYSKLEKDVAVLAEAHAARIDGILKKREKAGLDRHEKLRAALLRMMQTELPQVMAESLQRELMATIPNLERFMVPAMYMPLESSADVAMQAGLCDPLARQLDKPLAASLTVGMQARLGRSNLDASISSPLQDVLSQLVTSSLTPVVQRACRTALTQVNTALAAGTRERLSQLAPDLSGEARALEASAQRAGELVAQVGGDVSQSQRDMQAAVADAFRQLAKGAGAGSGQDGGSTASHIAQVDPREDISQMLLEERHEDAFQLALARADPPLLLWLCCQLEATALLSSGDTARDAPPLSQGVLLSLIQQLGAGPLMDDMDTAGVRLAWTREAAMALEPGDPLLAHVMRPILGAAHQNLSAQQAAVAARGELRSPLRLALHVLASVLSQVP